jgi:non-ribosomal peptide synthetase component F
VLLLDNDSGRIVKDSNYEKLVASLQQQQQQQRRRVGPGHLSKELLAERSLAYVLYTSGSTGKPKGVMVKNKGLLNVTEYFVDLLGMGGNDSVLGLTTLCFDISMLEVFMPLMSGARLVLVTATTQKNPMKIIDCLKEWKITIMQATPTTYEMLLGMSWYGDPGVKCLVGGEACRPKVAALAPYCKKLYNVYGPTETSIWSSAYLLPDSGSKGCITAAQAEAGYLSDTADISRLPKAVPVGGPIWATSFYLVDESGKEVKGQGEEGELWIGGEGVALGYLHADHLTKDRFLPNPFHQDPGEKVYKTGDLFRRLEDGSYVFVRRLDDQVKVNGYR